ncbi:hypothetical protein [Antarcticirhabdus aurantiaca]|uniref:Uncharacterized protein n=1 Tax=Antarcticirhabdus aurantiaca TaxID=2606717 RepID=A0ACD4NSW9_9HYPH|nr:hypothetical protein [Antarcticirhabdus aurantiaca]WAJ29859.1 hypothetical protein OXU80_06460 [Jeongeuplla avenae]
MRHADPSDQPEAARPAFGRRGRRAPAPLVIDGEAVLVSRRPRLALAAAPAAAPTTDGRAGPARLPRRPREESRDLIFSGLFARPSSAVPAQNRSTRRFGALPLVGGAAAGLVTMAAVAFAAMPSAPSLHAADMSRGGVTVSEVVARVGARNEGEVLSVEGVIRNAGKAPAAVPPLKLSLSAADGVVRAKPVVPLARPLGPGEVLRFQTMVAVPKGAVAGGTLDLGFWEPVS